MKISYNSQPQRNLIGNQIFKLRKSRKLSQKEMAAQLQVQGYYFSELTILRIEKGKRHLQKYRKVTGSVQPCRFYERRWNGRKEFCHDKDRKCGKDSRQNDRQMGI